MKLHGFNAWVIAGIAVYVVAHITDLRGRWLWVEGTCFREAAYCLN